MAATITFTARTRHAVVTNLGDDGYSVDLFTVVHPQRPDLGTKLLRRRATGSRFTAVGIAQDWVGSGARVEEVDA